MRSFLRLCLFLLLASCAYPLFAQTRTTVSGTITSETTKESLSAISVAVKGGVSGTFTDDRGTFKLTTSQKPPFTLVISSVGYASQEVQITTDNQKISVALAQSYAVGQEVVVGASRISEKILESPVSVERIGASAIRTSPASSYYDVLANVKGVDVTTSSLTFKTVSTRGFNGSGNTRFNQIVDGMDNQAPGLNFSVGSVIGLTELDVESMELLEGASSALYGPGGMNGTLLINSKSPFKYQGVSAQVREGIMNVDGKHRNLSPYTDISLRWGQKVSEKFAFKIGVQYIVAKDWLADDSTNYLVTGDVNGGKAVPGNRRTDPNYNGVNVYGDETSVGMGTVSQGVMQQVSASSPGAAAGVTAMNGLLTANPNMTYSQFQQAMASNPALAGLVPYAPYMYVNNRSAIGTQKVSRTGYAEQDVVPANTKNLKVSAGLYYKIKPDLELSLMGYYGYGNTVYSSSGRYALKNLKMGQYKLELKATNWFIRAYTTQEDAGDSYSAVPTMQLFNEAWKPSGTAWYPQYIAAYMSAIGQGADPTTAHNTARGFADQGRPVAGSARYNQLLDSIRSIPIPKGGLFTDKTNLYMTEGQYNLTNALKIGQGIYRTEVLVGADYKQYVLNSQGTLFTDTAGRIKINEYGAYLQLGQRAADWLKLTGSIRYDKQTNFKARFTPRISAVVTVAKDQYIRLSYQNTYRFPTTQNQYINLNTGSYTLIGGLPSFRDYYDFKNKPVYTVDGKPVTFNEYKPEVANSYEIGYKAAINKQLLIDVYGYYAEYKNFLTRITVIQPANNNAVYSISVNSQSRINTKGFGGSLQYLMRKNYFITGNFYYDNIGNVPDNLTTYYNTPKYRTNIGFGNSGFGEGNRFGFNLIWRWQDSYFNQSDLTSGDVPAFSTLDAQVSYKLPKQKLLFKLGGTNVTNHYYRNAYGNPYIGGLYYISIGYNVF